MGHVFNVPSHRNFKYVENVLREKITTSPRDELDSAKREFILCDPYDYEVLSVAVSLRLGTFGVFEFVTPDTTAIPLSRIARCTL